MKFSKKLLEQNHVYDPCVLTIGFFDGMHLGHQAIFKKIRNLRGSLGYSYVLSFSNHPKTVTKPDEEIQLINTEKHRIELIKEQKANSLILIPFTTQLQEKSPDAFISELLEKISFTDLVLGPDSTIGKDKAGDFELMKLISKKYAFKVHRVEPVKMSSLTISSTLLRKRIQSGDLNGVEKMLARPYSIMAEAEAGNGQGNKIGFPTLNFAVDGLCLPPHGVYRCFVRHGDQKRLAIANLGFAPTLKERTTPILEVHLLENSSLSYGDCVEVVFDTFIRAEKKFDSIEALQDQIKKDIQQAKA